MPLRAETIAKRLVREHGIERPPVPVELLADRLGAQIRYLPFEGDLSGMLFRDSAKCIIGVNSLHHPNRQRFTIAHEIGHMLLHRGDQIHVDRTYRVNLRGRTSSQAVSRDEMESNTFAAALLMPEEMLAEDLRRQEIDFESEEQLRVLATNYGVSLQALNLRLINLGLISPGPTGGRRTNTKAHHKLATRG